ncbi:nitrate reductase cytochrome c-type subunit [Vibrio sp. SCSIO 43136]|uniref:nitrate reductase cytochrome c-type subunit n=1 Tax=Vibrio sp. SCSIO 43136 TaxID=2819101 RepID=UPI002075FDBE|nr:nitrate reductase cytochrome c-type subunit [Vibrio sp. SCSIO 43136]USD68010.1 nitrate reductase cytochrome c-type subunit [Vibrio sp. SCSIO 43136]
MKNKIVVSAVLAAIVSAAAVAEVTSLRGAQEIKEDNVVPELKHVPKSQDKLALDYVNQPPLIPHSTVQVQVNQANNGCLECHDVSTYRKSGAPRISPTHYMDRDNNVLTEVAPRRYFCLQCHVTQVDAKPIVENDFKPTGKFGQ